MSAAAAQAGDGAAVEMASANSQMLQLDMAGGSWWKTNTLIIFFLIYVETEVLHLIAVC